jgi:RNA polymerase primary sigma factor
MHHNREQQRGSEGAELPPGPERRNGTLVKYFKEITAHPLLSIEQEQEIARRIVSLELREWQLCLDHPPLAKVIAPVLEDRFPQLKRRLRFICTASARYRKRRGRLTVAERRRYRSSLERLSAELKVSDIDRVLLDDLERWILGSARSDGNGRNGRNGRAAPHGLPDLRPTKTLGRVQSTLAEAKRRSRAERDRFISANLRLVISIAKRYNRGTLSLSDLIQEGNIGLMKAVQRYDPERGYRFSTYASWWIRHAINRALADKSRTVRLPVHLIDAHNRLQKARNQFQMREGREPCDRELAREMDVSLRKLRKLQRQSTDPSFSLDRTVGEDNSYRFIDLVHDEDAPTPVDDVSYQDWCQEIQSVLAQLPPIEAQIVCWRYGVRDDMELTLKEIGERYNLSRERIRQLQQQAIVRMRENVKGLY